jgi:hypothetical protein
MADNKKICYIFFIILIILTILIFGCQQESNEMQKEQNDKKTIVNEESLEGDIFSKDRWKNIKSNISNIKIGMKKQQIIKILGNPDGVNFTPKNVMQYSTAYGVVDKDIPSESIHILLDDNNQVIEVRQNAFIYGPLPH